VPSAAGWSNAKTSEEVRLEDLVEKGKSGVLHFWIDDNMVCIK